MTVQDHFTEDWRFPAMHKFSDSLPGRILTVILATLSTSALAYLIFLVNRGILPVVLKWVLVCTIGVVAGFATRFFLSGRTLVLRMLTILLALLVGLIFLGLVSRGTLGAQSERNSQSGLNLDWLEPFSLACAAALLSLSAWKGATTTVHQERALDRQRNSARKLADSKYKSPNPEGSPPPKPAPKPSKPKRTTHPNQFPVTQRVFWSGHWANLQGALHRWWEHGLPNLTEPQPTASPRHRKKPTTRVQIKRVRQPSLKKSTPRSRVKLVGKEEHRCPYCLEEVTKNDPRGVIICPICHTHHHADCWAVTGTCQVPHIHQ